MSSYSLYLSLRDGPFTRCLNAKWNPLTRKWNMCDSKSETRTNQADALWGHSFRILNKKGWCLHLRSMLLQLVPESGRELWSLRRDTRLDSIYRIVMYRIPAQYGYSTDASILYPCTVRYNLIVITVDFFTLVFQHWIYLLHLSWNRIFHYITQIWFNTRRLLMKSLRDYCVNSLVV